MAQWDRGTPLHHDKIVTMGEVENGAGALVQHIRIETIGLEQRHVALDAQADFA